MHSTHWSLVIIALCFASNVRADEWPIPRGASREPLPYRYDAKALTIPKEFLDDATACVLYSGTNHLIEPDGTVETVSHEITRLNSRKGIDKYGEFRSISYDPTYEKLTLNVARVIKANGTIVEIQPKHVQLRDVATDFQVYDQDKQLVISFPNLEVGDTYEVKWTVRSKNREFDGHFFTRYSFGDDSTPTLLDELRVRVPKNKTLKHATINGSVQMVVTDVEGEKLYHWAVRNKPELPRDEDRPSKEELRLQVAVSTFPSWEAIGQWKEKLRAECWKCTPEIRKIVEQVTRGKDTKVEQAKALTYWVRRHVRYLSRGPGGLGYTPHMPHQVLDQLYGDCKDQAQLLAVMLREIGLPVWLVTLGTVDDGQVLPDVPSPWGTHAILLTKIDGKDYWIDTTVSLGAWDFLPRTDRDRQTYITRDGDCKLVKTPPFTYKDYRVEQTTFVNIQPDGTSRCKRESTYHNSSAWSKRDKWLEVPPGERRRGVIAELQDAFTKAKLHSFKLDEKQLLEFDRPVRAELDFEVPKHFTAESAESSLGGSLSDSPVYTWFLGYNIDAERRLPYVLPTQFESLHKYVVQLPEAFRLETWPENREVKSPWGFFKLTVVPDKDDARRFELHMHFRLEKTRVQKGEFADFTQFQDDVTKAYRVWIYYRPTRDIADADKLEKRLASKERSDAASVKILAKLYLENERAGDARRVLEKASALHPADKAIWDLRVQSAANIEEEESLYRAMVKQFPDDAKYEVALGAVCVRREDYEQATKILTPLAKHKVAAIRAAALYQLARSEYRQQNAAEALKHLQASLIADSSAMASIDALHFKARVHEKLGQLKDAIACLEAGVEADPSARDALEYLVRLEVQAGMREGALEHLRRYTVAAGKDLSHMVKAADLHLQLGRHEEAFDLASRARELGFQAKAQRVLGLVHLAKHEYTQAAFHLDRCDLDARALAGLITAQIRLGNLDAAQRAAEKIKKMADGHKDLLALEPEVSALVQRRERLLAAWNVAKEKQPAARDVVSRYVSTDRGLSERWPLEQIAKLVEAATVDGLEYAPILAARGWLMVEKGQLRKGLADAEEALKSNPTDPRALLVRGRVRLEQGNLKGALSDLRKAAELTRNEDATTLHWLAAALLESGQARQALETQRLAVLLRPNDAEFQDQLRQMEAKSKQIESGPR